MEQTIMIILTAVYVLATILIWLSNRSSAIATRDQIKESHAQFIDANRAFVNIDFEIVRDGLYVLKIGNFGKRIAKDVSVKISDDYINLLPDSGCKIHIQKLNTCTFSIGIGQSWFVTLGSISDYSTLNQKAIGIQLEYSDDFSTYHETLEIDTSQYAWSLLYRTSIDDMRSYLKTISEHLKKVCK